MDFIRVGKQRNSSVQLAAYKRRAVVVVMGPSHGRVLGYSLTDTQARPRFNFRATHSALSVSPWYRGRVAWHSIADICRRTWAPGPRGVTGVMALPVCKY